MRAPKLPDTGKRLHTEETVYLSKFFKTVNINRLSQNQFLLDQTDGFPSSLFYNKFVQKKMTREGCI